MRCRPRLNRGRLIVLLVSLLSLPGPGLLAQPTTSTQAPPASAPSAPPIRRWLDVQQVQLSMRYRWIETSSERVTASTVQWQPQLRARVLFDEGAKYTLNVGAFAGPQFNASWNNTGAGIGPYTGNFNVKQLFFSAQPGQGFELQLGGLYPNRGEQTEVTSYDNDAFVEGERVTWRRAAGAFSQIALTTGYLGDLRETSIFYRARRMDEWNYGQLLFGMRLGSNVLTSFDYTYERGRDIVRAAVTLRSPIGSTLLTALKLEGYKRAGPAGGTGFNVAADLRLARLSITTGVASIDRNYLSSLNADRFDIGRRVYVLGTYPLTSTLSIGWYQGEAFGNDFPIGNQHRYEALLMFNPTATLKRARVF